MAEKNDVMDSDASPGAGVRLVNNVPVYLFGAVVIAFLFVMYLVAADRADQQNEVEEPSFKTGNTALFAKEIAGDRTSGLIQPLTPTAGTDDLPPLLIARPENPDAPPSPATVQTVADDEAERIRMAKFKLLDEAAKARTGVQIAAPRPSGSGPGDIDAGTPQTRDEMLTRLASVRQKIDAAQQDDPTAAYQARLAQIRRLGIGDTPNDSSNPSLLPADSSNKPGNGYAQYAGSETDRWRLDSAPQAPRTLYELRAGFVIPATLISGINSDLPGQIMAQVARNVYDTPTGKFLLIPQGSRLVGTYSNDVSYAQARILVAWQRIVFPDGKAMDIGAMPGADSAGYAGFNDQENHHYVRLFGSALLMSAVTAAVSYSQRQNQATSFNSPPDVSSTLSQALGQQLGQATAQLIAKNLNIAPTLEIRPGFRFNVIVTKDLTFSKPYQAFDYSHPRENYEAETDSR